MTRRKEDFTPEEWETHLAKKREQDRRWRERNAKNKKFLTRRREEQRRYYARHKEKCDAATLKWRAENPDRVREYQNDHKKDRRLRDLAYRLKLREASRRWYAKKLNLKVALPLFEQVLALIPFKVEARFDIASEAMIALLEGRATTPAEAIALGRKVHYRQFSQFDKKTISLDAPLANGGNLHDLVADESAAWGDEAEEAA